ncbi:MAG: prepilin peptidase [Solirubrobacterales bacterium]|nr:prepilin peptidase [Solirubrobacterales bacterium]
MTSTDSPPTGGSKPPTGAEQPPPGAQSPPTAPTRARSPVAIAVTIALAAAVAATQSTLALSILRGALVLALVPCALIDLERRIIPNRITGPAAAVALVLGLALDPSHEPRRLLWAVLAGGFLLLAALASPAGMGMGDVKLLAVIGLFLGPPVVVALLLALLGSSVFAVVIATRRGVRRARRTALPFGPFLAGAALLAAVVGDPLLHSYLTAH